MTSESEPTWPEQPPASTGEGVPSIPADQGAPDITSSAGAGEPGDDGAEELIDRPEARPEPIDPTDLPPLKAALEAVLLVTDEPVPAGTPAPGDPTPPPGGGANPPQAPPGDVDRRRGVA